MEKRVDFYLKYKYQKQNYLNHRLFQFQRPTKNSFFEFSNQLDLSKTIGLPWILNKNAKTSPMF